jgi:hypothetical protein
MVVAELVLREPFPAGAAVTVVEKDWLMGREGNHDSVIVT